MKLYCNLSTSADTLLFTIRYDTRHRRRLSVRGTGEKFSRTHRRRKGSVVGGGTMASAEHEPIIEGLGAEPSAGSRGRAAESILVIGCPTEPANLAPLVKLTSRAATTVIVIGLND